MYCEKTPDKVPRALDYAARETLPVGGVPDITVIRPPVNLAILGNTRPKRIGRGGDALLNRRGIVGHDAFILVKLVSAPFDPDKTNRG